MTYEYLDLIGPGGEALKQQEQLIANTKTLVSELVKANKTAREFEIGGQGAKTMKDATVAADAMTKQQQHLSDATEALGREYQDTIKILSTYNGHSKEFVAVHKEVVRIKEIEERISRANNRATRETLDAYGMLNKQATEAARAAKNYAINLGETHPVTVQAVKDAKAMSDQLKRLDASVGQHQRSVGDYSIATRGLQGSISQIARELPALGNGFATFAMAIGNNIAPAADAITAFRTEQKALAAEGKPTQSLFKALAGSIFNFQTLLIVGVTLLTVYGKEIGEWGKALFSANKSINEVAKGAESLNKALDSDEVKNAVKNVQDLNQFIRLAKEGFVDKEKVVRMFNETIGKTVGEVGSLEEAEKSLQKNADAFIRMTIYKTAALKAQDEAADEIVKNEKQRLADEKRLADQQKAASNTSGKDAEQRGLDQFFQQAAKSEKKFNEETGKARVDSLKKVSANLRNIAGEIAKENGFDLFGGDFEGKALKTKIDRTADRIKELKKKLGETIAEISITLKTPSKSELDEVSRQIEAGLKTASSAVEFGVFDENQAAQTKKVADDLLNVLKAHQEQKKILKDKEEEEEKQRQERMALLSKQIGAFLDISQEIGELQRALSAARIAEIDNEIKKINEKRDAEILAIESSSLSEDERRKKIAQANMDAAAQAKKLEQEKIQAQRKAAVFEKAITVSQIIAQTALAVISALKLGPGFAIAAAAVGAAQLAKVVATPLPQYASGVDHSPEGPAIVGEQGREIRIDPDGTASLTPAQATLTYLKKGTKIIPAHKVSEMAKMYGLGLPIASPMSKDQSIDLGQVVDGLNGVKSAIERKPVSNTYFTWQGVLDQSKIGRSTINRTHNQKH